MPSQVMTSVENNFTRGLITEATGLNFPENAATVASNCEFTLIGDVTRREGIDFEVNNLQSNLGSRAGNAVSSYKWNNAGGDGLTQVVAVQNGSTLYFYKSTASTTANPLSTTLLVSSVNISTFLPANSPNAAKIATFECQYTDGNGYLFIFHPYTDPFYCTYINGTVTATVITVQTRDFKGVAEPGVPVNFRPPAPLPDPHNYNIHNQGWQSAVSWSANSTSSPTLQVDSNGHWTVTNTIFAIPTGLTISSGSLVTIFGTMDFTLVEANATIQGQVLSYSGGLLSVAVISCIVTPGVIASQNNLIAAQWTLFASAANDQINTWFSALSNYPSNADVWWIYKNASGVFDPATTIANFPPPTTQSPQGHFILNEFNQQRSLVSGTLHITDITTFLRPKTGVWFQGRVWFTGVDDSFQATGTAVYTTWTENIYFSQVAVEAAQFGNCYQENDPTAQDFNTLLPTDGGVIVIPGSGSIFKLFPIVNGMVVFAANGVWFITGRQGIGFTAEDYTVTKLSSVQSISCTSFVDVMGMPYFWNEEGIYTVNPDPQGGSLAVNPITVGTILSFYNNIPLQSKKFVRGAYHPIDYVIQWIYKSTNEVSVTDRYAYDSILNYNVYNKAFFPHTVDISNASINSILYVTGPGGSNTPMSTIKYIASYINNTNYLFTFADEHDTTFKDWTSAGTPINFISTFTTGYKLHGQGQKRTQVPYVYMFTRNNSPNAYYIQSVWDYATTRHANRYSNKQQVTNFNNNFGMLFRRHRLRGMGIAVQFMITSVDGQNFDLMGWSVFETVNQGV